MLKSRAPAFGLNACPSIPHRAVAGLLSLSMGLKGRSEISAELSESEPKKLAAIAQSHFIDVALMTGFENCPGLAENVPSDLVVFFAEMQRANVDRNKALIAQLDEIGAACARVGMKIVALKGAAELLSPYSPHPGHRYVSDLDLLVAEVDMDKAIRVVKSLGGRQPVAMKLASPDLHPHHLSPFVGDTWPAQVELHRSVGSGIASRLVSTDRIFRDARVSKIDGVLLPAPADRIVHLVAHAQLPSSRYERKIFSLRDCMDLGYIMASPDAELLSLAEARFAALELSHVFESLFQVARHLFIPRAQTDLTAPGATWARKAIQNYGRPRYQMAQEVNWVTKRYIADILGRPENRAYRLQKLRHPRAIYQSLSFNLKRIRRIR